MESFRKIIAYCLFPLSVWYGMGVWCRNRMFDWGWKRSMPSPLRSIGVGNLSTGGTGKTPHGEYLLRLLKGEHEVAFLSRGYKRRSEGFHLATEATPLSPGQLLGDEPAMVAQHFPDVTVAVCEKRMEGLQRLQRMNPNLTVVLDDVYQHRYVRPTVMVLLTEYAHPYDEDRVLPFGNLREHRSGSRRADIIVVTKCPQHLAQEEMEAMRRRLKPLPHQRVFFSYLAYGTPEGLYDGKRLEEYPQQVTLLTGIAHPQPLRDHLASLAQVDLQQYPDHHDFTTEEIRRLVDGLAEHAVIITTEKDAARLRRPNMEEILRDIPIYLVPIQVAFCPTDGVTFDQSILEAIS